MSYATTFRSKEQTCASRNCCLLLALLITLFPDVRLQAETWTRKADVLTPRGGAAACVVDGKIWLIGGNTAETNLSAVEMFDPATNVWTVKSSLPTARGNIAAAVANGLIYTFGGGLTTLMNAVEVLNPATGQWTTKAPLPVAWKGGRAVVMNGIVYNIGGSTRVDSGGDSLCYAYDPAADSWTAMKPRPVPGSCAALVYRGEIYTFGGHTTLDNPASPAVLIFNPRANSWRRGSDMPTARAGLQALLVKGKIYVIGGWQVKNSAVASVEVYDPLNDSWTKKDNMPSACCYHAGAEFDGKIYIIGGTPDWWNGGVNNYEYNPAPAAVKELWASGANVPTPRGGASASVVDGRIYLIGGSTAQTSLNANELFDPATQTWQPRKPMPTARGYHAAAVVNGVIFTFGGGLSATSTTVEAYDPAADSWTTKKPLPVAMTGGHAEVLNGLVYIAALCNSFTDSLFYIYNPATDTYTTGKPRPASANAAVVSYRGLIYTFGGGGWLNPTTAGPVLPAVCAYDPVTNSWTKKADMPTARAGLQAHLLNGKIYVLGGFQARGSALAAVEVYEPLKDSWQKGMDMPHRLCYQAGAEVDGVVYVLGGTEDWLTGGEFNYVYDPAFPTTSAVEPKPPAVKSFVLCQNYPNPFNPLTTIGFNLPQRSYVSLAVYNVLGQKVAQLLDGEMAAGSHEARFDAHGLASGIYYYRLQSGQFSQTRSLVLQK